MDRELPEGLWEVRERSTISSGSEVNVLFRQESLSFLRHELRTPVNHIIGYSELLQEQASGPEMVWMLPDLRNIQTLGQQLLVLINQHFETDAASWDRGVIDRVSYAIRTHLNAITGYAEMLVEEASSRGHAGVVADLEKVLLAARRLFAIVNGNFQLATTTEGRDVDAASAVGASSLGQVLVPPAQPEAALAESPDGLGGFLLVVDDNELSREMLTRRLVNQGHQVMTAENGRRALEMMRAHAFDLVLLDVMMPEMDGIEVLERMKADDSLRHIPVIVLSALNETDGVVRCIELGAEDYLPKPFNSVVLRARLNASLEKKRLHDQEVMHLQQIEEEKRRTDEVLHIVVPLGIALSGEPDFDRLAERVLVELKTICRADGGMLYLRSGDHLSPAIVYADSLGLAMGGTSGQPVTLPALPLYASADVPNHASIATLAALTGQALNIPDLRSAPESDFAEHRRFDEQFDYSSVSALAVPLRDHTGATIGVIQLLNATDPMTGERTAFSPYLQEVAESLASGVAVTLNNQLLRRREAELVRLARDMEIGRQIQQDFLPEEVPQVEGWRVEGWFQPARSVSGDFYDVFRLPEDHLGLVLADVCDKGVPAALFMALIRSLIRAFGEQVSGGMPGFGSAVPATGLVNRRLSSLVADLSALNTVVLTNDYITRNHSRTNMFATLFFGVLDPSTGSLTYVNGGHEPPVVLNAKGIKQRLTPTGPAVGMLPGVEFDMQQTRLDPGDILFAYTDGVTDARNAANEFFSEERLLSVLLESAAAPSTILQRLQESLAKHVSGGPQFDDITVLLAHRLPVARRSGRPGQARPRSVPGGESAVSDR